MSKKATNDALADLHSALAGVFKEALKDPEKATPSMLNAVRQYLKDNGVEASPTDSSPLQGLADQISEMTYDTEGNPVVH